MTNIDRRLAAKRPRAGQHFVKQHAERKDVGAFVDAIAARLLGRSVGRRAVRNADFSQFGVMLGELTTGKRLKQYHYTVVERDVPLQTAAGNFSTVHLADANKSDDEGKELWLGKEAHYLPVRLIMKDDGATIAQTLTSVRVK